MRQELILVINTSSTSTAVAIYAGASQIAETKLIHDEKALERFDTIWEQLADRETCVLRFLEENHVKREALSAVISRGGHTRPLIGGVYGINDVMLRESRSERYGNHPCDLGLIIAHDIAGDTAQALTMDTPSTDEFHPLARYSGLPQIERHSRFHALNHRAVAKRYARDAGGSYEALSLVTVHMGGGVTIAAHQGGRMIDATDGITGDGPFSTNRSGGLPVGDLVALCYSGKYTFEEMKRLYNRAGGMYAYLHTVNVQAAEEAANGGDAKSAEVLDAMCYQTAKEIAAYASVLYGAVDAILLTGGMAHSKYMTERIIKRVSFIAPVVLYPGEFEMETLANGAYEALTGKRPILWLEEEKP